MAFLSANKKEAGCYAKQSAMKKKTNRRVKAQRNFSGMRTKAVLNDRLCIDLLVPVPKREQT
jgi:hypothetical protein